MYEAFLLVLESNQTEMTGLNLNCRMAVNSCKEGRNKWESIKIGAVFLAGVLAMGIVMTGCSGKDETEGKTVIEMVQYKPEAVDILNSFRMSSMQRTMIFI